MRLFAIRLIVVGGMSLIYLPGATVAEDEIDWDNPWGQTFPSSQQEAVSSGETSQATPTTTGAESCNELATTANIELMIMCRNLTYESTRHFFLRFVEGCKRHFANNSALWTPCVQRAQIDLTLYAYCNLKVTREAISTKNKRMLAGDVHGNLVQTCLSGAWEKLVTVPFMVGSGGSQ